MVASGPELLCKKGWDVWSDPRMGGQWWRGQALGLPGEFQPNPVPDTQRQRLMKCLQVGQCV